MFCTTIFKARLPNAPQMGPEDFIGRVCLFWQKEGLRQHLAMSQSSVRPGVGNKVASCSNRECGIAKKIGRFQKAWGVEIKGKDSARHEGQTRGLIEHGCFIVCRSQMGTLPSAVDTENKGGHKRLTG